MDIETYTKAESLVKKIRLCEKMRVLMGRIGSATFQDKDDIIRFAETFNKEMTDFVDVTYASVSREFDDLHCCPAGEETPEEPVPEDEAKPANRTIWSDGMSSLNM